MTTATGCSSSTAAALSPAERHMRRARRESELAAQAKRHNLPGFNVPEGGKYQPTESLTSFAVLKSPRKKEGVRPSPWGSDEMAQHDTLDSTGKPQGSNRRPLVPATQLLPTAAPWPLPLLSCSLPCSLLGCCPLLGRRGLSTLLPTAVD